MLTEIPIFNNISMIKRKWLITGVAGFIGSSLLERLLMLDQEVIGLDNFSTGYQTNLDDVCAVVGEEKWRNFQLINGDVTDFDVCMKSVEGVDHVLHQAALGSVPRSLEDPLATNLANVTGFLNILEASRKAEVTSFTYAASSSTYGDSTQLPKVEDVIGKPLSPYALTKYVNELYSDVYELSYAFRATGLRYFNVFGPRQDPGGAYAAVIPKWIGSMLNDKEVIINGDGSTSRDFCFIENVVQANLLAALAEDDVRGKVYNIGLGDRTSLTTLAKMISDQVESMTARPVLEPSYGPFRRGDVAHSQASILKAQTYLNYDPGVKVEKGIELTVKWFAKYSNRC